MSRVKKSENSWKLRIIAPPPRENKEMFFGEGGGNYSNNSGMKKIIHKNLCKKIIVEVGLYI